MSSERSMWEGFITFHLSQDWLTAVYRWQAWGRPPRTGTVSVPSAKWVHRFSFGWIFDYCFVFVFVRCAHSRYILFFIFFSSPAPLILRLDVNCERLFTRADTKQRKEKPKKKSLIKMSGGERNKWHVKRCSVLGRNSVRWIVNKHAKANKFSIDFKLSVCNNRITVSQGRQTS